MSNVRGRDLGSFVREVRSKIERDIRLPTGYFIEYGGQFENQQRATRRLMLIVPMVIAAVPFALTVTLPVPVMPPVDKASVLAPASTWRAWLPKVMTSTPAPRSSSAILGVIPRPPATFSALTTTNVGS